MRCGHCGSAAVRRDYAGLRHVACRVEGRVPLCEGCGRATSGEPPRVSWAVVRPAVQARRPGQASIPAAGARGESGY